VLTGEQLPLPADTDTTAPDSTWHSVRFRVHRAPNGGIGELWEVAEAEDRTSVRLVRDTNDDGRPDERVVRITYAHSPSPMGRMATLHENVAPGTPGGWTPGQAWLENALVE
jgi:hypothetical protein